MNEVLAFMIYVGGFIMAIVWIVFPFTVARLLKEIVAQLKHVLWELRKLNGSENSEGAPKRPSKRELEDFLGPR